ncbi:MAG TPA: hypothetical protein EYP23_01920 [Thermoplasmata archaeon]|nr:hypothetical protein [Thermoplasmata archaeon]
MYGEELLEEHSVAKVFTENVKRWIILLGAWFNNFTLKMKKIVDNLSHVNRRTYKLNKRMAV